MQKEFGERRNYKELQKRIDDLILIADSGYFSNDNMYVLEKEGINGLIMLKSIAQQVNNEIRKRENFKPKLGKNPEKSKKNFKRVKGGYICPENVFLKFQGEEGINFRKKEVSDLPYELKERRYIFGSSKCKNCKNNETCVYQRIEERITPLQYEMIEKFANKKI